MRPVRKRFWQYVATEIDRLNIALLQDERMAFPEAERAYLSFQRELLRRTEADWEVLQIKRLIAHCIHLFASLRPGPWEEFSRALNRVRRLGYINADYQARAAHHTLLWVAENDPTRATLAWKLLAAADHRLLRLRRNHLFRKQGLETSESVRQQVARKGLFPPGSPKSTSRRRT